MRKSTKYKLILLLIVPFVVSLIINLLVIIGANIDSYILLSITTLLLYIWGFAAIFFWFYVGMQFGNTGLSKMKSFLLGNSLWMISLLLYIWQFILLKDAKRNLFIAGLSQDYALGFVGVSSKIMGFFTNTIDGDTIIMISHLIMLLVFAIGFLYAAKNRHLKST